MTRTLRITATLFAALLLTTGTQVASALDVSNPRPR
jgi:hypothetical protein